MAVKRILQWLAQLVALIGAAPAFFYLDLPVQLLAAAALLAGAIADQRQRFLLPALPATLLSFLFFFFYLAQMSRTQVVEPLVNMLVLLLAVRLITEKSGRNLLQIFVLATFILAASSLLSLDIGYLAALVLLIVLVTFGLLLTSFFVSDPTLHLKRAEWRSLLRTGLLLPGGSLLLMFFFFAVLPRTQYPLWNFLNPKAKAASGLSEEVKPGSISQLGSSGQAAFRAEMEKIDPQQLYWRGLVLNQTDGRSWTRNHKPPPDRRQAGGTALLAQTIYTEPRGDRYLPALDLPLELGEVRAREAADGVFSAWHNLDHRSRYRATSTRVSFLQLKNSGDAAFYLQTPEQVSPRLAAVAARIAALPERAARIRAAQDFFGTQRLSYANRNLVQSATPVETFLFETRRGYCEYFASSFALLLRLSGVPTRLVGGYLGGRYNDLGGYYLIDEDMAHVWVEVLDAANRWQRIDPSRLAINAEEAVTGLVRISFNWEQSLRDYLDSAWNRLVITYDLQSQLGLLFGTARNLQRFQAQWPRDKIWWFAAAPLLLLPLLLGGRHRGHSQQQRLLAAYLRRVRRAAGLKELPPHLGLFALAEICQEPLCRDFARIYGTAFYAEKPLSALDHQRLRTIIRQLRGKKLDLSKGIQARPPRSQSTPFSS